MSDKKRYEAPGLDRRGKVAKVTEGIAPAVTDGRPREVVPPD